MQPATPIPQELVDRPPGGTRLLAIGAFLIVVAVLTTFCGTCLVILAGARAYSTAAGQFSRGQKNAVILLQDYLDSRNEQDFGAAQRALAAPLAARVARELILADELDYAATRQVLGLGADNPPDVRAMVFLGRIARHSPAAQPALDAWAESDAAIAELQALAQEIHRAVRAAPATDAQRRAFALRLFQVNDRLEVLEVRFSNELSRGARWVQSALTVATIVLALFLTVTRLLFMRMMAERLQRSHAWIVAGNARWALAAQASSLGLLDWRPDTDTLLLDDRARAMFGIVGAPAGSLAAHTVRAHVHPDDRGALRAASEAAISGMEATRQRFRVQRIDGSQRTLEMSARAFSHTNEEPSHMSGMLRDVTDDVDAEALRTEEASLQRANRMKSRFFTQVSHELRTPLNAILGFSELLRDDDREILSGRQRMRIDRVIGGGRYLLQLVNDLLDRASLEEGRLSVTMQEVALRELLDKALAMIEPISLSKNVNIDCVLPPESLRVYADPIRLTQVIVNVVSNAIKYNRAEGTVFLRCTLSGDLVELTIRDEGQGLTEAQQKDLFLPFQRLGAEATTIEGAGLGLVISRHLMEQQGGELAIESRPGAGTTARLRIKGALAAPKPMAAPPAEDVRRPPLKKAGVVLYIEDDPTNVLLVEHYMKAWSSVTLLVARDGQTGLACARARQPDLIVLDMQLPDMTGLEVIQALRADAATSHLHVVALSASAMGEQTVEAMEMGVDDYLTKPISGETLRREVAKYLH